MISTQSKHFIMWLVALTLLVVVVAVTLQRMNQRTESPLNPDGTDILNSI